MKRFILVLICSIYATLLFAQKNNGAIKFGDITTNDLATKIYSIDSQANAVVLYNYGHSKMEANSEGAFNLVNTFHQKIKILNKEAFDLANYKIYLFNNEGGNEKIESFQAATYNLVNGEIITTKVEKSSLKKSKINEDSTLNEFTFSDIQEGSIIECSYKIISPDVREMRDWFFQLSYPVLWSEFYFIYPNMFEFVALKKGVHKFSEETVYTTNERYDIMIPQGVDAGGFDGNMPTINNKWVMQNIPAMEKQNFVTSMYNYLASIRFYISGIRLPGAGFKSTIPTWIALSKGLMASENFGAEINKKPSWAKDEVKRLTAGITDNLEKAKKIYNYVQSNIKVNYTSNIDISFPIKKIFQNKKGNAIQVNALLATLLSSADLPVKPILLSTRENGKPSELYPIIDEFNYMVCYLEINDQKYFLDASSNKLGFGKLPLKCYNGAARLIDTTMPSIINISADSLLETTKTNVYIINKEEGLGMTGSFTSSLGYSKSTEIRERLLTNNESDIFNEQKNKFEFKTDITNSVIENLNDLETSLNLKYNFSLDSEAETINFLPLLTEAIKENPFKETKRNYPIEMPYTISQTYLFSMETPKEYEIAEMPKSARILLNETEGLFEYLIAKKSNGSIQLKCVVKINVANFNAAEDFETLKGFYNFIIQKESEPIVFKKKK